MNVSRTGCSLGGSKKIAFAVKLLLLLAILPLSPLLKAQSVYGSIVGTVTDSSGAAIPGAAVTITNLGTDQVQKATSDQSGNFTVVNLEPATYEIQVEKTNFKRFLRRPITLHVNATVRVDAALQVGAVTQTVEVTTAAPLLQTDSSTVSQEIEGTVVQQMPLNGRNVMNLLALTAGVVPQGSTAGSTGMNQNGSGHTNNAGWGWFQIGGSLAGEEATYIDGAPTNVLDGNTVGLVMTQDAVQEFNVATNNVSAEFGGFGGGVVNMVSKSGTNSFHGTVYEYLRNSFFNANDYFNKLAELSAGNANKPLKWNQNQYGVAIGGPIKRNKAFFHFTWEGFQANTSASEFTSVPTTDVATQGSDMMDGIFPDAIKAPAGSSCTVVNNGNGTWSITNLWSAGCGDPLAKIIRGYYPPPNATPSASNSESNFYAAPPSIDKQNQYNARIDYSISSKQHIFGRYTYWNLKDAGENVLGNYGGWQTENATSVNVTHQAVLGDTYTFSPTTLLDVHLSYLREYYPEGLPYSLGTDPSTFPGTYYPAVASQMSVNILPVYGWGSGALHNLWSVGRSATYALNYFNTYAIGASLIHIVGNHNIKIGVDLRRMENSSVGGNGVNSGSFTYNGGPASSTGDEWGDFLLGDLPSGLCGGYGPPAACGSLGVANISGAYNYDQGYYVTDTWQATHRLTLNLGLRYELPGGVYEKHNLATVLLPSTTDGGVKGVLALVNSSLYGSGSTINVKHDLFAPRLGFAYRLDNDTVVRGGYGLSYLPIDLASGVLPSSSPVNTFSNVCISGAQMANCFTALTAPPGRTYNGAALINDLGYYDNPNESISGPDPDQSYPYVQQWNVAFSHQLASDWMMGLAYTGSKGTHLPALGSDLNQLPDSYDSLGAALENPGTCGNSVSGQPLTVGQCDRPYSYYGNVSDGLAFSGNTIYHALQVKTEKRFKSAGVLMANYTWSKTIGDTDSGNSYLEFGPSNGGQGGAGAIQDYDNMKAERSVLSFDVPQRAVISYVLNLPFGKGQRWGSNVNSVARGIISGWGVNGITTFQHGFHLSLSDNDTSDLSQSFGAGTLRPDVVAGCNKKSPLSGNARIGEWFNTACFVHATTAADPSGYFTFGDEPRVDPNAFAQGIANYDFSAMKTTNVTENTNLQFRAEFFNIFNRKQLAPPYTSVDAPTYGTISADANQPRLVQFSLRANF